MFRSITSANNGNVSIFRGQQVLGAVRVIKYQQLGGIILRGAHRLATGLAIKADRDRVQSALRHGLLNVTQATRYTSVIMERTMVDIRVFQGRRIFIERGALSDHGSGLTIGATARLFRIQFRGEEQYNGGRCVALHRDDISFVYGVGTISVRDHYKGVKEVVSRALRFVGLVLATRVPDGLEGVLRRGLYGNNDPTAATRGYGFEMIFWRGFDSLRNRSGCAVAGATALGG